MTIAETELAEAAKAWREAQALCDLARWELQAKLQEAADSGLSERTLSQIVGLPRIGVRRMLHRQ